MGGDDPVVGVEQGRGGVPALAESLRELGAAGGERRVGDGARLRVARHLREERRVEEVAVIAVGLGPRWRREVGDADGAEGAARLPRDLLHRDGLEAAPVRGRPRGAGERGARDALVLPVLAEEAVHGAERPGLRRDEHHDQGCDGENGGPEKGGARLGHRGATLGRAGPGVIPHVEGSRSPQPSREGRGTLGDCRPTPPVRFPGPRGSRPPGASCAGRSPGRARRRPRRPRVPTLRLLRPAVRRGARPR